MCKFIGKSNEWIFSKLRKSKILRLYSIVRVAIETTKMPNFTCQSKSFISIFFTCQVSACEMQPFSCHDLANDMYSQTAKIVFSRLNKVCFLIMIIVSMIIIIIIIIIICYSNGYIALISVDLPGVFSVWYSLGTFWRSVNL